MAGLPARSAGINFNGFCCCCWNVANVGPFLFFETFAGFPAAARPRSAGNGKTLAPFTLRSGEIPRRRGAAPVNSGAYVWPLSSVKFSNQFPTWAPPPTSDRALHAADFPLCLSLKRERGVSLGSRSERFRLSLTPTLTPMVTRGAAACRASRRRWISWRSPRWPASTWRPCARPRASPARAACSGVATARRPR